MSGSKNTFGSALNDIESLQEANSLMKRILDSSFYSVYIADGNGKTLYVNSVAEKNIGVDRDHLMGKNVDVLEREGVFSPSAIRLALKEKKQITLLQHLKNGLYLNTGTPLTNSNGTIEYVVANGRYISGGIEKEDIEIINFINKTIPTTPGSEMMDADVVNKDPSTKKLLDNLREIASYDATILFTGESGVGKSTYAKYLHKHSSRSQKKFVEVSCGAIPESLLESELFGYEGGSFTGSKESGKKGLAEIADGGILFLDEIGELPLGIQVKLLQLLQEHKIRRIGSDSDISLDLLVIAATNKNLAQLVKAGDFREDLYYRLNVLPIDIKPLRERRADIPALAEHFLSNCNRQYHKRAYLSDDSLNILEEYSWPGNVRELENLITRTVLLNRKDLIEPTDLMFINNESDTPADPFGYSVVVNRIIPLRQAIEETEQQLFKMAYADDSSSYKVAEKLKISQSLAYNKIKKYINPNR